jgi:hypothetical protein
MKTCRACAQSKPLGDFYRHPKMTDGAFGSCKECVKARVRQHRAENLERVREYDRNRPNAAERAAAHLIRAKERGYGKGRRYPTDDKRRARNIVDSAIRDGKLKAKPCERCGFALGVQAHHEDYSKPLDVVWLCTKCHGARHREINAERRAARKAAA